MSLVVEGLIIWIKNQSSMCRKEVTSLFFLLNKGFSCFPDPGTCQGNNYREFVYNCSDLLTISKPAGN